MREESFLLEWENSFLRNASRWKIYFLDKFYLEMQKKFAKSKLASQQSKLYLFHLNNINLSEEKCW